MLSVAAVPSSRVNEVACRMAGPGPTAGLPVAMVTGGRDRLHSWPCGGEGVKGSDGGEAGSFLHKPLNGRPTSVSGLCMEEFCMSVWVWGWVWHMGG